jgi:hypothetical protein
MQIVFPVIRFDIFGANVNAFLTFKNKSDIRLQYINHIICHIYQYWNIVLFQTLNYVHLYDIYKLKVFSL